MTERELVDTRLMKRTGQYRLRFRLSDDAYGIVTQALSLAPYDDTGASLDAVCMNSLSGSPAVAPHGIPAVGRKRLLVRLFPDQYQCLRDALDHAGEFSTDADALLHICRQFLVAFGKSFANTGAA